MIKIQMTKTTKTIVMGTPYFAATIFKKLYQSQLPNLEIVAVITAPDKPVGRKQELVPSPVKKFALKNNLNILQPEKINSPEWIKKIKALNPDLIIVTAYGQIIPKKILDIPKFGALNIHPSLLPKYRGASPIQATILNGDKIGGITMILMDEKMDHGPVISNFQFPISNKPTYEELSEKLANVGADLLIKVLPDWILGRIEPKPQKHPKATFCKIIKKENGKIDWRESAKKIERQIRAFHKWPNAFTSFNNKQLKILEAEICLKQNFKHSNEPGKVFFADDKKLAVQTNNGILILKQVQLEGKRQMNAKDFLNGHSEIIGTTLK